MFDLEGSLAFHRAYHNHPVNVVIHTLLVWPMLFTVVVLLTFTPPIMGIPPIVLFNQELVFNFGFLFVLSYALFYIYLDKKAGSLAASLCFGCWFMSSYLAKHMGFSLAWRVVLAVHVICWAGQVIGHKVFEKRAPDLVDNLAQALLTVPFFVLLEVLEKLFGYEPYPGFTASVKTKLEAKINAWKDTKTKKTT